MITFNDDGVWEQNQDDMIEFFGIVIEDEKNDEPNCDILIAGLEDEEFLREEIENNLEKN